MTRCFSFALPALLLCAAAACQSAAADDGPQHNIVRSMGPANVAVIPPRTAQSAMTAPTEALRRAAVAELLARGYSTLNLVVVDGLYQANPAAPSFQNSGLLDLLVYGWNEALADTEGVLHMDVEANLYAEDGGLVGTVRLNRSLHLSTQELSARGPSERRAELLRQAVAALLEPFPGPPPL